MSYTALYRKWRPDRFEDVKGQDAIVTTLRNQVITDRIGHAYLFCGTRGTGKTTLAKIFAKTVNCEQPVNGSPCGECSSCKAIAAGSSMNVIEIDAASNNGVENVREIREEVSYSPAKGKYKVYIIDEVHMLSAGAFNALLKTLEEPPAYVIFILATTEAHKLPVTILSRCQRYDFKRISVDVIVDRLQEVMRADGIEAEKKAVRYIAKAADGAMRDALSLLDQCTAFYFDKKLTFDNVLEVLGAVDTGVFSDLLRSLMAWDIPEALKMIDQAVIRGRDLRQFVTDLTWYLRNLLLVKATDGVDDMLDMSTENQARLKEEAKMIDATALIRYIRIFSELSDGLRYATQKRVLTELAVIKLCKPETETDLSSVLERIRALEDKLESGDYSAKVPVGRQPFGPIDEEEIEDAAKLPKALSEDIKKVVSNWQMILQQMPEGPHTFLKTAKLSVAGDDKLLIVLPNSLGYGFLTAETQKKQVAAVLNKAIGKEIDFELRQLEEGHAFKRDFPDLSELIHMEIETED